jgi:uncharacterized protein (TIGR00725 family)
VTIQVAVCGPSDCTPVEADLAYRVGELLAGHGVTVLCGGGGGVMAAVAEGARVRTGLVIGVWPGGDRVGASPHLDAVVATNMGEARNAILVSSADAVIAIGGSWGTLSEVALAMRRKRPVISLGGWQVADAAGVAVPGITAVTTPDEAVEAALRVG